jgi:hypothetical protein
MSDDKKRDRALQRRVRERQAKTGESYQAAWRQVTEGEALPTDASLTPLPETKPATEDVAHARLVLPLQLPRVPQRQPTRVATRATRGAVDVERLYISAAGTPGGAADWIVNDIEIDGRSQLAHKDLPGALFGGHGVAAGRGSTTMALTGFDPVERNREVAVIVTYVGPNPEGIPFYASIVGSKPAQRPTVVPITSKVPLLPFTKTTLLAKAQNAPFQIDRVEIQHDDTEGGAADWIINDIKIAGQSQFVQSGDIPGDMFATQAIDNFIGIEPWKPGRDLEIEVTYIGLNERGAIFSARLEGMVLRDDYSVAPPDLHVLVETIGQGPGDLVVATCNWRAPASDNRTR